MEPVPEPNPFHGSSGQPSGLSSTMISAVLIRNVSDNVVSVANAEEGVSEPFEQSQSAVFTEF